MPSLVYYLRLEITFVLISSYCNSINFGYTAFIAKGVRLYKLCIWFAFSLIGFIFVFMGAIPFCFHLFCSGLACIGVFGCYSYYGGWQFLLVFVAGVSGRNANGKARLWKDEMTELVVLKHAFNLP